MAKSRMRKRQFALIKCMRIRDMVNSQVRVQASLQLDQSRAREFSDMAKSPMRTREFAQIMRMRICDIVNCSVHAHAS